MNTLILSGFGTNCERETRYACEQSGAPAGSVDVRHISEIYAGGLSLDAYRFVVLIGGFLDGDDLGGGRACANRFRYRSLPGGGTFLDDLRAFVQGGGLMLGICNGFQLLVQLGLLPGQTDGAAPQAVTLTTNARGRFEDRWVRLHVDPQSPCVFTRGLSHLELPVRHGEGRILGDGPDTISRLLEGRLAPMQYSSADGQPTEQYPDNPNGSPMGIAALCNPAGTVMGLMPHPEGYNHPTNHPRWTRQAVGGQPAAGEGLVLFRNAYAYLAEKSHQAVS